MASDLQKKIEGLIFTVPKEVRQFLRKEGEITKADSMKNTPIEYGALRGSHEVIGPESDGRDIEVQVTVGGPSADYAVYVHENLEAHHPVGEAKFLEDAVARRQNGLLQRLADTLKSNG